MKGFRMPAFYEIAPDQFISPAVIRTAQKQAVIPEQDRVSSSSYALNVL